MKVLIVFATPEPRSFNHAILKTAYRLGREFQEVSITQRRPNYVR